MVNYQLMLQEQFDQLAMILVDVLKVIGHNMRTRFLGTQCGGVSIDSVL